MRKYSLPLKMEVLSIANGANTKPYDVIGEEWLITDTYEEMFLKVNHINEDGECYWELHTSLDTSLTALLLALASVADPGFPVGGGGGVDS